MNMLELEAQKAELARVILFETDEKRVSEWMVFLRSTKEKKLTTIVPEIEKQSGCLKATSCEGSHKHRTIKERLIEFYGEANAETAQDDSPIEIN